MRILYLDIDSLRPDHLGCYGYHRNTSPCIDALARDAMLFTRCHTSDAPCLPSRTAMYSGRFGIQSGVVGHGGTAASPRGEGARRGFRDVFDEQGLARQLQHAGLKTAMISPFGQRHAAHWFYAGFNEIHNTGQGGMESAETVWPVAESWLRAHAAKDGWFLHLNFWDPHTPYRAPAAYGEPFADAPLPAWLEDPEVLARHQKLAGPHTALDVAMYDGTSPDADKYPRHPWSLRDRSDLRRMIDGYDTAVRYVDDHVGRIVALLREAGVYDDTVIILSADHGENLGELGLYGEHATADSATCRIPLIVKWPGGARGRCDDLLYNVDLAPTLAELLGRPACPVWDGISMADTIRTGRASRTRDELVFGQCAHVCQRAVRWGDWLYMRTYHCGFHDWGPEMVFNLAEDPHEQHDLAAARPDICREGAWRLERWHAAQMARIAASGAEPVDPLWHVMSEGGPLHARLVSPGEPGSPEALGRYLTRLEATGRGAAAARLRARYLS